MISRSSIFAWRIPWTEEPGGLRSTGSQRVGHNLTTQQCEGCKVLILGFFFFPVLKSPIVFLVAWVVPTLDRLGKRRRTGSNRCILMIEQRGPTGCQLTGVQSWDGHQGRGGVGWGAVSTGSKLAAPVVCPLRQVAPGHQLPRPGRLLSPPDQPRLRLLPRAAPDQPARLQAGRGQCVHPGLPAVGVAAHAAHHRGPADPDRAQVAGALPGAPLCLAFPLPSGRPIPRPPARLSALLSAAQLLPDAEPWHHAAAHVLRQPHAEADGRRRPLLTSVGYLSRPDGAWDARTVPSRGSGQRWGEWGPGCSASHVSKLLCLGGRLQRMHMEMRWHALQRCVLGARGRDPDAAQDRRQEEKGMTEDEMLGWHHRLHGHELE